MAITSSSGKAGKPLADYGADDVMETGGADSGLDFSEVVLALTGDEGADVVD